MTYLKINIFNYCILSYLAYISVSAQCSYSTKFIILPVDHFGYTTNDTFSLRYLVNRRFFIDGGPIFFYTGNEGDIKLFAENTGLLWDWQLEFKAMVVFAEHRYYGKSLPYGNQSFSTQAKGGYLTAEQALADFVDLIDLLKSTQSGASKSPVVAFGGSYGGMLTAWLRMKYPASVVGGLAASAPIWQFEGLVDPGVFNEIVTRSFERASKTCSGNIRRSWSVISSMYKDDKRDDLIKYLRLCKSSGGTAKRLKEWLAEIYTNLAMVNYPYAANFLEDLPPWPVKASCIPLDTPLYGVDLLRGVGKLLNVYFNKSGTTKCFETDASAVGALSDSGWNYQSCNEMVMPMSTDGVNDMFEPQEWNLDAVVKQCTSTYGLKPRPYWISKQFGGKHIEATNIIFSNGLLDPWSSGGVMSDLSDSLISIVIDIGAHHLDLRQSNPADPPSLLAAREREKSIVRGWIHKHNGRYVKVDKVVLKTKSMFSLDELLSNPGMFIILVVVISCFGTIAFIQSSKPKKKMTVTKA